MPNTLYNQLQSFTLYSSGASVGDTEIVLSEFKDIDGNLLTMEKFGDKGFMTLDPGVGNNEEQISFSGVTQNANGTATLTGVKNVLCVYPYTETDGLKKQHSGGSVAVVSITSGLLNQFANKKNDETITGTWSIPTYSSSDLHQPASIEYVNNIAISGAPNASENAKGIIELATAAECESGAETGETGARLVVPASNCKNSTTGAADAGKIPVLGADGLLDQTFLDKDRVWNKVQSFAADKLQITTDASSPNDAVRKSYLDSRMFGDGSDGDLVVSSGTTILTENKIYQYKSINIASGATLTIGGAADNLPLALLCTGDVQINGTINLQGKGAAGGIGQAYSNGAPGSPGIGWVGFGAGGGGGEGRYNDEYEGHNGGDASGYTGGAGGAGGCNGPDGGNGGSCTNLVSTDIYSFIKCGITPLSQGAGGGSGGSTGGSNSVPGGNGGNGGGALLIAAKGNVIIGTTGQINCKGNNGNNGSNNGYSGYNSGGGGGGGGGSCIIKYGGTFTNSGTITVAGGNGGIGASVGTKAGNGGKGSAGLVATMKVTSAL
jgi:hypothetical protein